MQRSLGALYSVAPVSPPYLTPTSPFIGCDREQVELRHAPAADLAGRMSLVRAGGEAGTGETAPTEALMVETEAQDTLVLVARCHDLLEIPPAS